MTILHLYTPPLILVPHHHLPTNPSVHVPSHVFLELCTVCTVCAVLCPVCAASSGGSLILVSHDEALLAGACDRITEVGRQAPFQGLIWGIFVCVAGGGVLSPQKA